MTKLKSIASKLVDGVSGLVGYAAVREWTPSPGEDEFILDLKAYTQVNSFACGATAGFSVVKTLFPHSRFEDFYALAEPDPDLGTPTPRLAKALRQSGVSVKTCSRLSYCELIRQIGEGRPVILTLSNPKSESRHWVVAYGHGPDHIVLASNGLPWVHRKRFSREDFLTLWEPRGNGLICWAEVRRPRRRSRRAGQSDFP